MSFHSYLKVVPRQSSYFAPCRYSDSNIYSSYWAGQPSSCATIHHNFRFALSFMALKLINVLLYILYTASESVNMLRSHQQPQAADMSTRKNDHTLHIKRALVYSLVQRGREFCKTPRVTVTTFLKWSCWQCCSILRGMRMRRIIWNWQGYT